MHFSLPQVLTATLAFTAAPLASARQPNSCYPQPYGNSNQCEEYGSLNGARGQMCDNGNWRNAHSFNWGRHGRVRFNGRWENQEECYRGWNYIMNDCRGKGGGKFYWGNDDWFLDVSYCDYDGR